MPDVRAVDPAADAKYFSVRSIPQRYTVIRSLSAVGTTLRRYSMRPLRGLISWKATFDAGLKARTTLLPLLAVAHTRR